MIENWILDNFKSINREKKLPFRKLTIFTGANSSGKSTILQSILLVSQTLQNNNASRSIILNGWFKKFGSYSDIVNCKDISKNIKIGFTLSDYDDMGEIVWFERFPRRIEIINETADVDKHITCEFVVSSAGKNENLLPELESVLVETVQEGKKPSSVNVTKRSQLSETEAKVYEQIKDDFTKEDLSYAINCDVNRIGRLYFDDTEYAPIGVGFNHFLPEYMIGYCRREDYVKRMLKNFLMSGYPGYFQLDEIEKKINPIIKEKALKVVDQLYNKDLVRSKNSAKNYNTIKKSFNLKRFQTIIKNSALDEAEKTKYVNQVVDEINGVFEGYKISKIPLHAFQDLDNIRRFFRNRIKYLGPLREEPKSLYPLNNDGSSTEVGLKGENTAVVYHNNKNTTVEYIDPDDFKNIMDGPLKHRSGRLSEAVNKWLVYMGVADDIVTDDRGKIGHTMQISNGLNIKQDLTHVGVGVSQVLPILVMSLLAKKGDVIILEQPELHLHPKVQTRLADFFVSMNAIDKQCIVETHSEYMINRLRYLVAITEDSTIADNTMMYFVERDKAEGYSKYRQVTINRYGVIEDWPDGFFDESERIAMDILHAGMKKKAQEEGEDFEE